MVLSLDFEIIYFIRFSGLSIVFKKLFICFFKNFQIFLYRLTDFALLNYKVMGSEILYLFVIRITLLNLRKKFENKNEPF